MRLDWSDALGRKIRQDDVAELGIPTWTLIREAIQTGRTDEALELVDHSCYLERESGDVMVDFVQLLLTHIASFGEEEVMKVLRQRALQRIKGWLSATPGVMETLQRCTELQRSHQGNVSVTEEPDRYVVTLDPCGSGGRLRRTRSVATTKKAYPWTWSKSGIPYYCIHCPLQWEIVPIELRGYPIRITEIGEKPEDPCVHLFYKRPELIPEDYFTRVGKTKTIK